jgi:CYTH domain
MLEVEEKFDLMSSPSAVADVERRLSRAGFVRQYVVEMVDWYFDDAPTYSLALSDCWLRYRQEQRRSKPTRTSRASADDNDEEGGESASQGWQLKRGAATSSKDRPSSSGATVYEETEGIQAVARACSLLVDPISTTRTPCVPTGAEAASAAMEFDNDSHYPIPAIPFIPQSFKSAGGVAACPAPPELVPFARIVTHRIHWIHKDPPNNADASGRFAGLVVDIDSTDFGHAVGEVEALVEAPSYPMHGGARDANHPEAVVAAQRLIRDFLRQVIYRSDGEEEDSRAGAGVESGTAVDEPPRIRAPAQGKLECYLEKFRPELHAALVEAGILRRPSAPVPTGK